MDVKYTAWNSSWTHLALCVVKKENTFNIKAEVVYDKDWAWIVDYANEKGYTVVDHDEYLKGSEKKYAAVLHKLNPFVHYFAYANTGTAWLNGFVAGNGGKIIDMDLEEYGASSLFGTIVFSDAYTGITWDSSMDWDEISPYISNYNKRILDMSRRLDGSYCVLFCDEKPSDVGKWLGFGNASSEWLNQRQSEGWRVQKRNGLTAGGQTTYSGVLVRKI